MVVEERKEVSEAKIGTQIFNEVWGGGGALGGTLFNVVLAKAKMEDFKKYIKGYTYLHDELGDTLLSLGKQGKLRECYDTIVETINTWETSHIDAWMAGLGMGLGGSLPATIDKYVGSGRLVSMVKGAMFQIGVQPWIQRWFNYDYTPNLPDIRTAFRMLMEGDLSRAEFNKYCQYEGWGTEWHDKLYDVLDRDPDERTAFIMYKRKLISLAEMFQCFKIRGYDSKWHTALYNYLLRVPRFTELLRMAEFVPLDSTYIYDTLLANGFSEADALRIRPAIEMRPLREEVRSVAGRYAWQYQIGRLTRKKLEENLKALGILPKELTLWMLWSDLRYADELIDEQIEILRQRVIKGDITTKEAIVTQLKNLGIREEKANLMGEDWYWRYLVP